MKPDPLAVADERDRRKGSAGSQEYSARALRFAAPVPILLAASLCTFGLAPSCKSATLACAGPRCDPIPATLPGPLAAFGPPSPWYEAYETPVPLGPAIPIAEAAAPEPVRRTIDEDEPAKPAPAAEVRDEKWTVEPMSNRATNQASSVEVK